MKRRKFIRMSSAGMAFLSASPFVRGNTNGKSTVTVAHGDDFTSAFNKTMLQLGGLKSYLPSKGKVILKPDISLDATPDKMLTTNPILVKSIVDECYQQGSRAVYIFDHCKDDWTKCYKNSGIERVAKNAGAKVIPGNHPDCFYPTKISTAAKLKSVKLHRQFSDCQLFLNVPVFKPDQETIISSGIKNLMGCVLNWNDYYQNGLGWCLAEFLYLKQPEVTIIDASNMAKNCLIASTDIVAADAIACQMAGVDPMKVEHLRIAYELGFGNIETEKIELVKIDG